MNWASTWLAVINSEVFRITVNDVNANKQRVQPVGIQICSATHRNPSNISRPIQYKQIMRDVMPCSLVDKRHFREMYRAATFEMGGKGLGIRTNPREKWTIAREREAKMNQVLNLFFSLWTSYITLLFPRVPFIVAHFERNVFFLVFF
jgi:hypothetical protein